MRIGFLLDGFTGGGIARAVSIVGNRLQQSASFDVFALAYSQNGKPDIYDISFPCTYLYPRSVSLRKAIVKEKYLSNVFSFIKENRLDVIIACGVQFYPVATFAARKCGIKSVCWEHTSPYQTEDFRLEGFSRRLGAKTSDCNVVLSRQGLDVYNEWFPRSHNVHIYNPLDPALEDRPAHYRADSRKIVSVGRLSVPKDFGRLLRLARAVFDEIPDWSWDIYGEGPMRGQLEATIRELNLQELVCLKGQVSDLYDRYGDYAFMVMTSKYEGFPMTLLEGAACSLPLVAFDVATGPKEIITDGKNGFICDPKDDAAMIDRIKRLIADPALRSAMSEQSRATVQGFHSDAVAEQWTQVLTALVR